MGPGQTKKIKGLMFTTWTNYLIVDLSDFVVSVGPDPSSIDLPPVGYQLDLKSKTVTHIIDIIEDWSYVSQNCYSFYTFLFLSFSVEYPLNL